jgi:outer membrane cobalamin receptor
VLVLKGVKMVKKIALIVLFFCLGFISLVHPSNDDKSSQHKKEEEQKKPEIHYKEEIIVTATLTEEKVKDCSASVSVLTEKDIKMSNVSNALNLLNFLPGVFIQRTGDFGRADVEIRGLGSRGRRIAIMVDGRPEKMGLYGCTVTHTFPLDNVSRIEVVRGASSVLYGSDALGGVVNIITKKIEEKFDTGLTLSYGTHNTQQYLFQHGGNVNRLNYFFTFDKRKSDGHLPNSNYDAQNFTGRFGYSLTDTVELTVQSKYFSGIKYEPGTEFTPLTDYWNDYKRGAVDVTLSSKWEKSEAYLKVYRNFGQHKLSDGWHSRDYTNGGVLRYTSHALTNNELTTGVEFRSFGGKSLNSPVGEWDKHEYAIFIHDQHTLWNRFILSAGARINKDSLYGTEFCPSLGLVFHVSNGTSLRANVNKGFRSPQLNELYLFPSSNPDLKPEKVWSYELGVNHDFLPWLSGDLVFYTMKGDNLIATQLNPNAPPLYKFFNVDTFTFKGTECGLRAYFGNNLEGRFFYTYLDPEENTQGRAKHKVDFTAYYDKDKLSVSFNAQYVAGYYESNNHQNPLSNYFTAYSKIDYQIIPNLDIFLAIDNIFDEKYKIYVDLPGIAAGAYTMPGRTFTVGTDFHF